MQNSMKAQRKSTGIEERVLELIVEELEETRDKIIQCEEKADGRLHVVG